ncbi:transcriptional regulator, RpiR family [Rhodoferax ferrireducens T118]|uniref:Transcriptional regulator, RpiR family n=1 Tax=Albidiferax ferrireducens (strain ATCC BAA-621 / DSM 15236 / T118) TaxID=338969 RepID=Q21ZX8_ALBFT|nr:MurR/RpiR family transcriptional regulator [Rhodoferax ferrireducens]ABD68675.1 transcriptional regulator, RpiR family [Rhodoferax ferrireducens T118]WPC67900.1 MurR/RpiR family transcriptional regulator [Rhodoferax ferrireducens]
MTSKVLARIAETMAHAPTSRRSVLAMILQDPQRVLDESFEQLAHRAGSSVPTVMRTCRDLGYPGLREFKLALAQELAVSGSPLHRRVQLHDGAQEVISKVIRGAATAVSGVQAQLGVAEVEAAADAIVRASRVDCYSVGVTSSFMASDMQARLFRLGLVSNAYLDIHLQLVSAATLGTQGVVFAISHVGGMPSLIEAVDVAHSQGATVIALTQQETELAKHADIVLGIHVPEDPIMHVGTEAYLVHLTVIEIVTVLVAQRLGDLAVKRLGGVREVLSTRGVDMRHYARLDWDTAAAVNESKLKLNERKLK